VLLSGERACLSDESLSNVAQQVRVRCHLLSSPVSCRHIRASKFAGLKVISRKYSSTQDA